MSAPWPHPYHFGSSVRPGLAKMMEEAGELVEVCAKILGNGGDRFYYDGRDLDADLLDEMADVAAALAFYTGHNLLPIEQHGMDLRTSRKLHLFGLWHHHGPDVEVPPDSYKPADHEVAAPAVSSSTENGDKE